MHKKSVEDAVTSLHDLSAVDLIAGYRAKQFSPSEVLEDLLTHVAAWEPHLKALYAFDPDGAREAAKASTARWTGGEPSGALDGVPVTVKDNIATKGVPVPLGAASVKLVPAEKDAPPAARLREAGAVIFAKTTMPDYGMLSSGLSSFHALARNPWDLSKNPGGSSAGAGAAAAAGYGPLHLGTDIGGSVRLPAGWCGLVGLKPSFGRVPIDPTYVGRVAGPMTRTVDDCALMMSVIAKPDRRDGMSLPARAAELEGSREVSAQTPHRVDARSRLRPGAAETSARGRGEGGESVRIRGQRRDRGRRHPHPRDARRPRQLLARADVG
ncbi:Asp-tRNA(Asn)/Glu-tRNA(Gln) amidotransferase A subunit family amidase [Bradyrhizobium ottawaense]